MRPRRSGFPEISAKSWKNVLSHNTEESLEIFLDPDPDPEANPKFDQFLLNFQEDPFSSFNVKLLIVGQTDRQTDKRRTLHNLLDEERMLA